MLLRSTTLTARLRPVVKTSAVAVMQKPADFILRTERFVREQIVVLDHDASHDWSHIDRVRKLALALAREEGIANLELVEIASLLHDIQDWKYSGSETAAATTVEEYLQQHSYPQDKQKAVLDIIQGIGFKDEIGAGRRITSPEFAVVQDADRLDAIGAIGIARCFTFGGKFPQPLYDPAIQPRNNLTKAAYMDSSQKPTTINHFYEKLLKLQGMMKTDAGRKRARSRHAFMEAFLKQFMLEWDAQA
ncbi:hypothetical protein WJX79_002961 [Trebouxia sp. C0005]